MIKFTAIGQLDSVKPSGSGNYLIMKLVEQKVKNGIVKPIYTDIAVNTDRLNELTDLAYGDIIVVIGAYVMRKGNSPIHVANKVRSIGNFFPRIFGMPFLQELKELRDKQKVEGIQLEEDDY